MKPVTRNRYQKAAFKPGERRVSRAQVDELLALSKSDDAEDRLTARQEDRQGLGLTRRRAEPTRAS